LIDSNYTYINPTTLTPYIKVDATTLKKKLTDQSKPITKIPSYAKAELHNIYFNGSMKF
jgi:hypothetical protein